MMINEKFLNIPPYLSTSWEHIAALHMEGQQLVITLDDSSQIKVPGLESGQVVDIFSAHSKYLQSKAVKKPHPQQELRFGIAGMDGMQSTLQHNPAQANAPEIPPEILDKIAAITKIISPEEVEAFSKAEPHCNCPHCQIARAVSGAAGGQLPALHPENLGEEVDDEELAFQQWSIKQTGESLFTVTNKLDSHESYNVFLGSPVGCTCGKEGCEHILAVLNS